MVMTVVLVRRKVSTEKYSMCVLTLELVCSVLSASFSV